ncbi:MAG: dihydropyrimidinase [Lachnospiraceae bacterium]|nr:dihydropyrimidinase [Lachnospiraceae bacterium]
MIIIQNGVLVTPNGKKQTSLAMENGKIVKIGEIVPGPDDEVVDASGCYVYPGFIDGHTHLDLEVAGTVTADDFESGTAAAAAGGTTCVVDFATQYKGDTVLNALQTWQKKAEGKSHTNVAFHMAICDWNEQTKKDLPALREAGVTSFKVYMAYDTAVSDAEILEILDAIRPFGGILGCHCENGGLVTELQQKELAEGHTEPSAHPLSRPAEVEAEAVNRFCYLGKLADMPINVVHLSTKLGLEEIREARAHGQTVYIETCPQYLLLDDSNYSKEGFEGAKYVCSPPLRKKADIEALKLAVLTGEVDTIATDHCSFNYETQKKAGIGNFTKIPNGAPGIEHRPVMMMHIFGDDLDPNAYCRLMSSNPAKLYGMYPQKGALLEGSDADVTVWDPNVKWVIRASEMTQNVDYTPFEGMEVSGRARFVYVNGVLAAHDGVPTAEHPGTYVKR